MAPTPSSSCSRPPAKDQHHHPTTPSKTPMSKHRLHFSGARTPNPTSAAKDSVPTEHPVEVIGRIRDHPEKKERSVSALDVSEDGRSLRLRTDVGYRDFSLDGVSVAEDEDLGVFYRRFVESRVQDVRLGAKCTVMMYGPTGSGKSHTMFGCSKQPGIVYRALRDILCTGEEEKGNSDVDDGGFGVGLFVQVAVLEIYNEEIYDILSGCNGVGGGGGVGLPKANAPKVRLEVMGKKAKNASYITGNDAGKISREVVKIEKRRIVKSTLCNERSSRSHCLIILDVPSVGGRLMLVDMAGSENIEQAGQIGFEAKMQTAKINQGNTALKRVVESIANGDSHVPFRDSKLTMLLQDSFEDDKSKILMILCASPDSKEMHKTMSTLEYGAKAKCIVRTAHVPTPKDKMTDGSASSVMLGSRIAAMNQFICKLQTETKQREKERDEARKELTKREDEVADLRVMLKAMEERRVGAKEEEINTRVDEGTKILRVELKRMEEKVARQERELEALRQRMQVVGVGGSRKDKHGEEETLLPDVVGSRFMKRLSEMVAAQGEEEEEDRGMEKSMDLEDMGDVHDIREVVDGAEASPPASMAPTFPQKFCLSTVFEGNEEEEEEEGEEEDEEVKKEVVVQEDDGSQSNNVHILDLVRREMESERELGKDSKQSGVSSRNARIQNIFRLCGNYREMAHHVKTTTPSKDGPEISHPAVQEDQKKKPTYDNIATEAVGAADKENNRPDDGVTAEGGLVDVYVKWETSGEAPGNLIERMKVLKSATLSDLRKLIEARFGEDNRRQQQQQQFTFLLLRDPTGAPVLRSKEPSVLVTKLPVCNNQLAGGRHHLACLRSDKKSSSADPHQHHHLPHLPLGPLENKIQAAAAAVNTTPPSAGQYIAQC